MNNSNKPFARLSSLHKDNLLYTKYTLIVNTMEYDESSLYNMLKSKYYFNESNCRKIKINNSSKQISNDILALIIYHEQSHKASIINLTNCYLIVKNKIISYFEEAQITNKDLIHIQGSIYYFFYSKEAKINNLKLRFRLKEKRLSRSIGGSKYKIKSKV